MDRKTFIQKFSGLMVVGIPTMLLVNCSSDSDDSPPPPPGADPNCLDNGTNSFIGSNHGHSLTVSKEDVDAGIEMQYNIQGNATHAHSVTVTSGNFNSLKNNQSVTISSTAGDGHTHSVSVSCA